MHLYFGKTTMCDTNQQTKKKNNLKQGERSLGMLISLMTILVATMLPIPSIDTTLTIVAVVVNKHDDYLIHSTTNRLGDT